MICYNLLKVLKFPTHVLSKRYPWVRECSSCFHYIPFIILKLKLTVTEWILLSPRRKWVFRNFLKKLLAQFTSFLALTLLGWVSWPLYISVFLALFSALWRPNIWPKMGFPELFEKTIGSIHFIPGIYPYGVSFLTPLHFGVPSLIFGPLVAKYLAENGVSGTFWKRILAQFISYLAFIPMGWVSWPLYIFVFLASFSWRIPTCVAHDCKIEIFIGYFWMRWVVIRAGVYCPHLWAQLV